MVLHYGNDLAVNNTSYNFSKIAVREAGFDATLCPPWNLSPKAGFQVAPGGLLPYPPSPLSLPSQVTQRITKHPVTRTRIRGTYCITHHPVIHISIRTQHCPGRSASLQASLLDRNGE